MLSPGSLEIINTGTELLFGSVTNTLLPYLGQILFTLGWRIERQTTVPDGPAIERALREAFPRTEIILVTGGLGPTSDDITRDIVAEITGRRLRHDDAVFQKIKERFARRNLTMTSRIPRQALVPEGAVVLPNDFGTAPGLYLEKTATYPHLFLFPGPPRELRPMFETYALSILKKLSGLPGLAARIYKITGQGESFVEEAVGLELQALPALEIGYCARLGEVDLRLIGSESTLAQADTIVRRELASFLVSVDEQEIEEVIIRRLTDRKETLAVAESCTGGLVADRLTDVPGSSIVLLESVVAYSNEAKERALGVPRSLIESLGAVSSEVAAAMAEGVCRNNGANYGLATTGIAGPGGGTDQKPVGTIFLALAQAGKQTIVQREFFPTDRRSFKQIASQTALDLLRRTLAQKEKIRHGEH
jgi:nicotinamide-nucleotide amidase